MLIISSAAYVPAELVAELGELPPSFMPLRNRRLYSYQLDAIAALDEPVILTLPAGYAIELQDQEVLERAGCEVVRTHESLTLIESLAQVLEFRMPSTGEPLRILHGDTVQVDLPLAMHDVVSVSRNDGHYPRAYVFSEEGAPADARFVQATYRYCTPGDPVLTGYLSFSDAVRFRRCLNQSANFVAAVNRYGAEHEGGLVVHEPRDWADCGHVNAYYRSRALNTSERAFNAMSVTRAYIRKSGDKPTKIAAERAWFGALPRAMTHYAPQIGEWSDGNDDAAAFYDIEYLFSLPLSDLYVFGNLSAEDWGQIFSLCNEFLGDCEQHVPAIEVGGEDWSSMYLPKTESRLSEFAHATGWLLDQPVVLDGRAMPSLRTVAIDAQRVIDAAPKRPLTLCHGDFCFSNVLYDARARKLKVIDPRGLGPDGARSNAGDLAYDYGKLFHSVVGGYDFVVAGQIWGEPAGTNTIRLHGHLPSRVDAVIEQFRAACLSAAGSGQVNDERLIAAVTTHLFLSMLPLHDDSLTRQCGLMSRALVLHARYALGEDLK